MQNLAVSDLIQKFNLLPHPEGGYFKETYRSVEQIPIIGLPERFKGDRPFSTAIYFLLEKENFSAFHKIQAYECWHFYAGSILNIYVILQNGDLEIIRLGSNIHHGETFQYIVPANCWFASALAENVDYSFVGCTVAPGFDFADFELANAEDLIKIYPQHQSIIESLCR